MRAKIIKDSRHFATPLLAFPRNDVVTSAKAQVFQTCEKRVQKFRTDEANFQPIRHTSQIWVVTRHQHGMSALVQTSFRGASQWWRIKMSAVLSRYIEGYKWCCVDSVVFVSLNSTELQSWNHAGLLRAHNLRYKRSGFDTFRIITVLPRLIMRRL